MFDHEKLQVYQLELQFITWATKLMAEVMASGVPRVAETCDHLDRASLSALFNTAEGNGKRRRQVRVRYFDDARGSVMECASCLDALVAKGATTQERIIEGKDMLVREYSMLTRLVQRFSDDECVHEDEVAYGGRTVVEGSENEDEGRGRGRLGKRGSRGRGTRTRDEDE
ncbi:MAG: four helix bundle protein [Planctomycetes bacterium]|nr:four helix bundle protein [Planctomycetota bacterium]